MRILALMFLFVSSVASAKSVLSVDDARIFAPLKGTNATAGYGVFHNSSAKDAVLTLKRAESFKAVELHETVEKDGRMAMQKVEKITVPAKGSFEMKPGAHHIMLFDADKNVKEGKDLEIHFEVDGKAWSQKFKVVPRVTSGDEHHHHH